jgi:hypothetical protein
MKKYILVYCICILLFVLLIFILNRRIHELEKSNSEMIININKTEKIFPSFLKTFDNFILYDNKRILNVDLIDSDGNVKKLSDIIEIEKMIIFLPKIDCHTCSAKEIELLKTFFLPKERKRICILAKFRNKRESKLFEMNTGLETFEIQSEDNLFLNKILNERPVVFLISPYLYGYCFLLDNKENYKLSEEYYKMIQKRFSVAK